MLRYKLKSFSIVFFIFINLFSINVEAADIFVLTARGNRKIFKNNFVNKIYPTIRQSRAVIFNNAGTHQLLGAAEIALSVDELRINGWLGETTAGFALTTGARAKLEQQVILLVLSQQSNLTQTQIRNLCITINGKITQTVVNTALTALVTQLNITLAGTLYSITQVGRLSVLDNYVLMKVALDHPVSRSDIYSYVSRMPVTTLEVDLAITDLITRGLINEI